MIAILHSHKKREDGVKIDSSEVYKRYDLHIHVPDGAVIDNPREMDKSN